MAAGDGDANTSGTLFGKCLINTSLPSPPNFALRLIGVAVRFCIIRQQRMFMNQNAVNNPGGIVVVGNSATMNPQEQMYGQPIYGQPMIPGQPAQMMYGQHQQAQMMFGPPVHAQMFGGQPPHGLPQPYPMQQYPPGGGMMSGPPAGGAFDNSAYARNPYASAQPAEAPLKESGYASTMALPVARVSYPPIPASSTQAPGFAQPQQTPGSV